MNKLQIIFIKVQNSQKNKYNNKLTNKFYRNEIQIQTQKLTKLQNKNIKYK